MNPRRTVTDMDVERIETARAVKDAAEAEYRAAEAAFRAVVVDATNRSSIRETAKIARVNPDTIVQWKKQAT